MWMQSWQTRWNQLATFYPFFRGHAHLDAKRREPWLFGDVGACLHSLVQSMIHNLLPAAGNHGRILGQSGTALVHCSVSPKLISSAISWQVLTMHGE